MTEVTWRSGLSPREIAVCELVVQGLNNIMIGEKLGISHRTVEDYRANAMAKLGVGNVVGLVRRVLGADP